MIPQISSTPSNTPSNTATITPTSTSCPLFITPTNTPTFTNTPTNTASFTPTNTRTPTMTPTPSATSGPAFDADAAAYLADILLSGATGITATISGATNTLFTDLKLEGIYSKLFALYPLLGGEANAHRVNAANLGTFTMNWSGGITHNADGVKGNGTTGIGGTQWVQNVETTTGNTSMGFYMVLSGNVSFDMGRQVSGGFLAINNFNGSTNFRAAINAGLVNFQTNMVGQPGFYGLARNNGTQVSYISPSNTGTTVSNNEVGALATSAVNVLQLPGVGTPSTKTYGTFFISEGLTLTELQNLSSIITTFNNTIGR